MSTAASTAHNNQDASSKWSGYNYQGKVALYVVLSLINNSSYLNKEKDEKWDVYSLEIEGLEDFSILKNNEYISLHQVKAYTSSNYVSSFKDALWGLIGKSIENPSVQKSYLHTLGKVNELKENNSENKKNIKKLEPTKKLEKEYKSSYINDSSNLEIALNKIAFYDDNNSYRLEIKLEEINDLVIKEIKKYYKENNYETYKTETNYLNAVFNKLLFLIDVYIYKRHNKEFEQNDYISFEKIIECIDNNIDLVTHEYFLFELRRYIGEKLSKHCYMCTISNEDESSKCEICNILKYKNEDIWIDDTKFIDFMRNINAHVKFDRSDVKNEDISKINEQVKGYNSILVTIQQYKDYMGIINNKITYKKDNNKYISTTINHLEILKRRKDAEAMTICQDIINNINNDLKLLVDLQGINGFISYDIDIKSIKESANNIGKGNTSDSDDKFMKLKKEYNLLDKSFDNLSIITWEEILEEE